MAEEDSHEKASQMVLDGNTGQELGREQGVKPQKLAEKFVTAAQSGGSLTENAALGALGNQLWDIRREQALEARTADQKFVAEMSQPKTVTPVEKKPWWKFGK